MYSHVAELLDENADLRRRILVMHYDDLCGKSEVALKKLYSHCQLDIAEQQLAQFADHLNKPSYYSHGFTDRDLAAIEAETVTVHARVRQLSLV